MVLDRDLDQTGGDVPGSDAATNRVKVDWSVWEGYDDDAKMFGQVEFRPARDEPVNDPCVVLVAMGAQRFASREVLPLSGMRLRCELAS